MCIKIAFSYIKLSKNEVFGKLEIVKQFHCFLKTKLRKLEITK